MDNLNIYIDRLKNAEPQQFDESLTPAFLELDGDELRFIDQILLKGEAYLVDDHLIVHLNVKAPATLPCSICNEHTRVDIDLKNVCLTIPLEEIKGAIHNIGANIRESILLQAPLFAECGGKCPERDTIKSFLVPQKDAAPADIVHFPFADL
ncbi:MAG: hypothetical protein V4492_02420 [Chlamydiota bacterium]